MSLARVKGFTLARTATVTVQKSPLTGRVQGFPRLKVDSATAQTILGEVPQVGGEVTENVFLLVNRG